MKVAAFINNRAEYGCLLTVLEALLDDPRIDFYPIWGGDAVDRYSEHYGGSRRLDGLLKFSTHANMARSAALMALNATQILEEIKPDRVIIVGDRYETLGLAMAAAYMNIVICHIQGGEVSGTIDESIRHAVTKLSHIHCAATPNAVKVIERLGENKQFVFLTGCPSVDLMDEDDLPLNEVFDALNARGVGKNLDFTQPYMIAAYHPVTTADMMLPAHELMQCLDTVASQKIVFHPNSDAGSDELLKHLRQWSGNGRVVKEIEPREYATLMKHAIAIAGNSSSGIRGGSRIGLPCVNIGNRQVGRERAGNVVDARLPEDVLEALANLPQAEPSNLYGEGDAVERIVKALFTEPTTWKRLSYELPLV